MDSSCQIVAYWNSSICLEPFFISWWRDYCHQYCIWLPDICDLKFTRSQKSTGIPGCFPCIRGPQFARIVIGCCALHFCFFLCHLPARSCSVLADSGLSGFSSLPLPEFKALRTKGGTNPPRSPPATLAGICPPFRRVSPALGAQVPMPLHHTQTLKSLHLHSLNNTLQSTTPVCSWWVMVLTYIVRAPKGCQPCHDAV